MEFDPIFQFGVVFLNENANNTIINFTLRGVAMGVKIRVPSDEELDTLPVYDINSLRFLDPTSKLYVENEI